MSQQHNDDSLHEYFTELLCDNMEPEPLHAKPIEPKKNAKSTPNLAPSIVTSSSASKTQTVKKPLLKEPILAPKTEVQLPASAKPKSVTENFAELEAVKREQLQALLSKQIPQVKTEAPAAKSVPKIATTVTEKVLPKEEVVGLTEQEKAEALMRQKLDVPEVDVTPSITLADEYESSVNSVLEWADNGRPQWAQERFDVLLFDVAGLTLAVPLIALGQIQTIGEGLTPIFGQSDWFMGLLATPHGQIRTVNTALFVMPEKYSDCFLDSAKYVISIDGLPWGLAVDSVNQPISLDPADVKWRTQRTGRPWLAGTVKSAMCALIDIPQMGAMLRASEKK